VENNFMSVNAASQMLGALGRQNNATLRILTHPAGKKPGQKSLARADAEFKKAFEKAAGNSTVKGESMRVEQILGAWKKYRITRDQLLAASPTEPIEVYNRQVYPDVRTLRAQIFELLELNQHAIAAADREARW